KKLVYSDHKKTLVAVPSPKNSASIMCSAGESIKISELDKNRLEDLKRVYSVENVVGNVKYRDTSSNTYKYDTVHYKEYNGDSAGDAVRTKLPNTKNIYVASRTKYGTPDEIYFNRAGTYTLTLSTIDGSNKTFKLKVTVR
ncbi:MAG: hypothetical protein IJ805_06395, partial [Lachnospiraceae bacterium]|nr:hypothetical protein [Lachnospiraceae bacterium]